MKYPCAVQNCFELLTIDCDRFSTRAKYSAVFQWLFWVISNNCRQFLISLSTILIRKDSPVTSSWLNDLFGASFSFMNLLSACVKETIWSLQIHWKRLVDMDWLDWTTHKLKCLIHVLLQTRKKTFLKKQYFCTIKMHTSTSTMQKNWPRYRENSLSILRMIKSKTRKRIPTISASIWIIWITYFKKFIWINLEKRHTVSTWNWEPSIW